jgi:hypothetical protein
VIAAKVAALKRGQTQIGPGTDLKTQAQAAEMLDVSVSSVGRAKAVIDRGSPELVAAVDSGEVGLRKAAETVRRDAEPARNDETAAVAEANTRKWVESNARINKRDVRVVFRQLSDAERRRFLAEANTMDDILAWRMSALDSQRRQIADAYFDALRSNDERLKHDEIVRAWVEEYERSERA